MWLYARGWTCMCGTVCVEGTGQEQIEKQGLGTAGLWDCLPSAGDSGSCESEPFPDCYRDGAPPSEGRAASHYGLHPSPKRMARKSTTQMPVFSTPPLVKMEAREPSTPTQKHALLGDLSFHREGLSGIGRPKQSISAKCQGKHAGPRLPSSKPVCSPSSLHGHRKHDSQSAAKIKPKAHSNFLLVESCAWFVSIKPGFCGITWPIYWAGTSKRVEPRVTQDRHFASYSVSWVTYCCWRPLN